MKIKLKSQYRLNDKNVLFKAYEIWIKSLLIQNVIFFSLKIDLCEFYMNNTKKNLINNVESAYEEIYYLLGQFSNIEFIDSIYGSVGTEKE